MDLTGAYFFIGKLPGGCDIVVSALLEASNDECQGCTRYATVTLIKRFSSMLLRSLLHGRNGHVSCFQTA